MRIKKGELAVSIAIPVAVGAIASFLTRDAMADFERLNQPPLSPPGWLFPVVWLILYVLMGIASYLVYRQGTEKMSVRQALAVYALQLFFNFFWTIFFFGFEWYLFSFLWLVVLWVLILCTIVRFRKLDETAAALLIPYLVWVTFAGYLNLGIYLLN